MDLEAALDSYAGSVPRLRIWQAGLVGADPARANEALALLASLIDHYRYAQEALHTAYRIRLTAGRVPPTTQR